MAESGVPPPGKPASQREDARNIVETLRRAGHQAYFAGGCVRDELLGLQPADYDVATDATPEQVRALFDNTQHVGAAFGVTLVRMGRSVIEVATFRADGPYHDGRHPASVTFTGAQDDARRRDFTINGLFLDPVDGTVVDFVGGREDLNHRIVRAIGDPDARFTEDYLRMLRAVRFAARFSMEIEAKTLKAIVRHAPKIKSITPERICDELRRMLTPPTRIRAWELLYETRLFHEVFRKLEPSRQVAPDPSVFRAIAPGLDLSFPAALCAIVVDEVFLPGARPGVYAVGPVEPRHYARLLRRSLRLSNDETDRVETILNDLKTLLAPERARQATKMRILARPTAQDVRLLLDAVARTGHQPAMLRALETELDELSRLDCNPPPILSGDDLVQLGYKPSPTFKGVLLQLMDAQLEGRLHTREDAVRLARHLFAEAETTRNEGGNGWERSS
jgi:poly(A) polymerase